jgi:hypothetical protein
LMLLLAAAGFVVAGCEALQGAGGIFGWPGTKSVTCGGPQCQVFVTVTDTASGCTITDPGQLHVTLKQRVLITWHVSPHDFTADGILFKKGQGTVFSGNQRTQQGVYQVWDDYSNGKQDRYAYRIKVTTTSRHTCELDPEVVNG